MRRQMDVDQLVRDWLDEGDLTPPDGPVWAALERIETTRQRGTMRVSLEERIMRMHTLATVAAVALMAIIGLAIYFSLTGGPNVGDPDASPTPVPGAVRTQEFAHPMAIVPPDGWTLLDSRSSVTVSRLEENAVLEQVGVLDTSASLIWSGMADGHVAWPADLAAWLQEFPVSSDSEGPGSIAITVENTSPTTVAGMPATVIDAATSFTATPGFDTSVNLVISEAEALGRDVLILDGAGRMRFVLLDDGELAIVYHARTEDFSEATFDAVLESIRLSDR